MFCEGNEVVRQRWDSGAQDNYSIMLGARIPVGLRNSNNSRPNAGIKTAKPFYRVYLGILALLCYRTRNCSAISFFSISRAVFRAVVFWRLAVAASAHSTSSSQVSEGNPVPGEFSRDGGGAL